MGHLSLMNILLKGTPHTLYYKRQKHFSYSLTENGGSTQISSIYKTCDMELSGRIIARKGMSFV